MEGVLDLSEHISVGVGITSYQVTADVTPHGVI